MFTTHRNVNESILDVEYLLHGGFHKGWKMWPLNITFFREVRSRKQSQLLLIPKKNHSLTNFITTIQIIIKVHTKRKRGSRVCHLGETCKGVAILDVFAILKVPCTNVILLSN
jgi:hypothetical protein